MLFFTTSDGRLWKSDGTEAGTGLVKDIAAGYASYYYWYYMFFAITVGELLFFKGLDGVHGMELWKSDGTEAGTVLVRDIITGTGSSFYGAMLTNVNGAVYFSADDGVRGSELWKSDGTEAGTVVVRDINPAGLSAPATGTNVNGVLFFKADDGAHGSELWKSDGTEAGTVLVKDIQPGSGSFCPGH